MRVGRVEELREPDPLPQPALPRARRPRDHRRRLRRARPRAARRSRSEFPELVTPDSPTQAVGGGAVAAFAPVEHAVPMMSLDNAFDVDELLAWGARLERRLGWPSAGRRLRVRAEDRRPRHVDPLRGRPLRPGRHPGRRPGRRGRHRQRAHDRRRPRAARRATPPDVLEVRGEVYMPVPPSRRSTSARPRPADGCSPTPATRPPARCARRTRRSPPAASWRCGPTSSARSRAARRSPATTRRSSTSRDARPPGQPRDPHASARLEEVYALLPATGRSTATTSTTRSTASS